MIPLTINSFVETTLGDLESPWSRDALSALSSINVPELAYGDSYLFSKSDINFLWASWMVESYCDSAKISKNDDWARIFKIVYKGFIAFHGEKNTKEIQKTAKNISDIIYKRLLINRGRSRKGITKALKERLLEEHGMSPRCWYCGYKFCDAAIECFLGIKKTIELPRFIDYMTGKGTDERHLKIEIDHVIPFSKGGPDNFDSNLKIACGWCNSKKSNHISIYGVKENNKRYNHPTRGLLSLPTAYWCIRAFGVIKGCTHPACNKTAKGTQLFISPKNENGRLNPYNIDIRCSEHDSIGYRLVPRSNYSNLLQSFNEGIF